MAAMSYLISLNELKAAIYANPIHTDDGIHSDHGYLAICLQDHLKGTFSGLEALQSNINDSYHKSVLYWPVPTINPWTSRVITQ